MSDHAVLMTPRKKAGDIILDSKAALYQTADGVAYVQLGYQKTGFGEKAFLICPVCGRRRDKLYMSEWQIMCREHLPSGGIYRGIQRTTKGGTDRIAYTMQQIIYRYGLKEYDAYRFNAFESIHQDRRPRYMRKRKYAAIIGKLEVLNMLRGQSVFYNSPAAVYLRRHPDTIGIIERASEDELTELRPFRNVMEYAELRYGQEWGYA